MVDVENASPNGFAVGFLVEGARADDVLAVGRKPGDVETDGTVVFPVPHRQSVRVAVGNARTDVKAVADWETVTRGVGAGARARAAHRACPSPLQWEVDAARADLLLAAPSVGAFVALEDWGFDDEAVAMWAHLGMRDRRRARRRVGTDSGVLASVRADVLCATDDTIELVPGLSAGVARAASRRSRCADTAGRGVVRDPLARRAPGAVVGCARRRPGIGTRARPAPGLRPNRQGRRCWPSRRRSCWPWGPVGSTADGVAVDAPESFA